MSRNIHSLNFFTSYYGKQNPEIGGDCMNASDVVQVIIALIILGFLLKEAFEK